MDKPCCLGVKRNPDELAGSDVTYEGLHLYTSPATENETRNKVGIIVVYDIFGCGIPNAKYIVDHLAKKGFIAALPDFYQSAGVEAWPNDKVSELGGPAFGEWFGKITNAEFWAKFQVDCAKTRDYFASKGCTKFGIVGFCWGGLATSIASTTGSYIAAVSVHGCHDLSSLTNSKNPILFLTVENDPYFTQETIDAIAAEFKKEGTVAGDVKVFPGVKHGFVVRGDFTDAHVKAQSEEAIADTIAFFDRFSQ